MTYVYIAGPYTGDQAANVAAAIRMANQLRDLGFVPFVPHLTHFWDMVVARSYADWLDYDLCWLERCDALLRMPGASPGADIEVGRAKELGIPVFFSPEELLSCRLAGWKRSDRRTRNP